MNEQSLTVEYQGKPVICSYTTLISETSCRVDYVIKIKGEKPAHIEYATEGDSDLFEYYSSPNLEAEFKEVVRRALHTRIGK